MFPKMSVDFAGLYGVISQRIELLINTSVRTSNPNLKRELYIDLTSTFATVFPPSVSTRAILFMSTRNNNDDDEPNSVSAFLLLNYE
jgi:hypothetical protein